MIKCLQISWILSNVNWAVWLFATIDWTWYCSTKYKLFLTSYVNLSTCMICAVPLVFRSCGTLRRKRSNTAALCRMEPCGTGCRSERSFKVKNMPNILQDIVVTTLLLWVPRWKYFPNRPVSGRVIWASVYSHLSDSFSTARFFVPPYLCISYNCFIASHGRNFRGRCAALYRTGVNGLHKVLTRSQTPWLLYSENLHVVGQFTKFLYLSTIGLLGSYWVLASVPNWMIWILHSHADV